MGTMKRFCSIPKAMSLREQGRISSLCGKGALRRPADFYSRRHHAECPSSTWRGNRAYAVVEERFTRDEMYIADEVFVTGTAAELTPVREIDNRRIGTGKPGPITLALQKPSFPSCAEKTLPTSPGSPACNGTLKNPLSHPPNPRPRRDAAFAQASFSHRFEAPRTIASSFAAALPERLF